MTAAAFGACRAGMPRGVGRRLLAALLGAASVSAWPAAQPEAVVAGARIYQQGQLIADQPLIGRRAGGMPSVGSEAACVNCHRRSGLGSIEGRTVIPPTTPRFLYAPRVTAPVNSAGDPAAGKPAPAYDEQTLARAIRDGIGRTGQPLSYLMPRFALNDADMAALLAYLRTLSVDNSPGATEDTLHFGVVIAPDADPTERDAMLAVLTQFVEDKNGFIRGGQRPMQSVHRIGFRVSRRWVLHVWQLHGPPAGWEQELNSYLAKEPVFALLSGLAGRTWVPVHQFCEHRQVPCLFPNVLMPVDSAHDFYSVYFSAGLGLEAQLIASRLAGEPAAAGPRRLVQVFRAGDSGEDAAAALRRMLPKGWSAADIALPADAAASHINERLGALAGGDVLMLWLRPDDLKRLPVPPGAARLWASGLLAGLDASVVPAAWRTQLQMAYPVELPERRQIALDFPLGWFRIHHIAISAEKVQVDTYLACGIVAQILNEMVDTFVREYLIERMQDMLGHRLLNGYYRRLSLASGQHFASKGGYIVRFRAPGDPRLIADSDWIVP